MRLMDDTVELVLTDMNMPGVNGLGVVQAVRERPARVPIIVMTGDAAPSRELGRFTEGPDPCRILFKPFLPEQLLETVEQVLASVSVAH